MRTSTRTRYRHFAPFALITSTALLLTACGSGSDDTTGTAANAAAKADKIPTTDVVSAVPKDEAAAKLLPSGVTSLTVAVAVGGTPPARRTWTTARR